MGATYGSGTIAGIAYVIEISDGTIRGAFTVACAAVLILGLYILH